MKTLIEFMWFCWDFFIPHFTQENVAVLFNDDESLEVLCCVDDLIDGEHYDCIATSKALVWLWWGFFATISDFRDA